MYQIKFTTAYKKSYKLMKKRRLDLSLLDEVVDLLRQGKQLVFSKSNYFKRTDSKVRVRPFLIIVPPSFRPTWMWVR